MHVEDVCRAIKLVMDKGELNEIYNIGSGQPTKVSEIVELAKKLTERGMTEEQIQVWTKTELFKNNELNLSNES